jgi:hypothetical protein
MRTLHSMRIFSVRSMVSEEGCKRGSGHNFKLIFATCADSDLIFSDLFMLLF